MAEPKDSCILHNEQGSDAEVGSSEIGQNGAWDGASTYVAAKFDDGSYSNNLNNRIKFDGDDFNPNKFIVEYWFSADGWNCVNGVSSAGGATGWMSWYADDNNRVSFLHTGGGLGFQVVILGVTRTYNLTTGVNWLDGTLHHIMFVYNKDGIDGGADVTRIYLDEALADSTAGATGNQIKPGSDGILYDLTFFFGGAGNFPFTGTHDNIKIYNDTSGALITAIIANKDLEGFPTEPSIEDVEFTERNPQVLILNSQIDLYKLGYVDKKLIKIEEKKTFQRDKIILNQIKLRVHNHDNQFNVDNPNSIFNKIQWRYQPFVLKDEDGNIIWDGALDDFLGTESNKFTDILSKNSLLKFLRRRISYTSDDWETPADAFKNIADDIGFEDYDNKHIADSSAVYTLNNCFIMCFFNDDDNITFQQAAEKIAKVGAADCYSAGNLLSYKLWQPFVGGVKFNLTDSDLRKNIKDSLLRVYYNDYKIRYQGDLEIPATDAANNNIGAVSRANNGTQQLPFINGAENQQIVIKDLDSAVFLGETHIKRTHINLSTNPFPVRQILFGLDYNHKDFINLQTWFRLSAENKGWTNKLFEVYINSRDMNKRELNITAYEVQE